MRKQYEFSFKMEKNGKTIEKEVFTKTYAEHVDAMLAFMKIGYKNIKTDFIKAHTY